MYSGVYVAGDIIKYIKENGTEEQRDKLLFAYIDFCKSASDIFREVIRGEKQKERATLLAGEIIPLDKFKQVKS